MTKDRKKRLMWQLPFLTLLVVGSILIIRQQQSMPYQKNSGAIFGTFYNVTYQYDDDLQAEIEAELRKVDAEFSMFNDTSTVARINRGEHPRLSESFCEIFRLAEQVSKNTGGAFDITVAPLVNAWGFGFKNEQMPDKHQVDSLRQFVGYQYLQLKGNTLVSKKQGSCLISRRWPRAME